MSWKCRLFSHKFRYRDERIVITGGFITQKFRKCQRCQLVQVYLNDRGVWVEKLKTLSDIRDSKLNSLGIK